MIRGEEEFEFIERWTQKFKEQIDEQVALRIKSNPDANPIALREDALLNKLATVYAGCVSLGERIKELERKIEDHT